MAFNVFQTATATLKRTERDKFGDESVVESFVVDIDPVLGYKRVFSDNGEVITGRTTIITPTENVDVSKRVYVLEYLGNTYQVESMIPYYSIGGNVLQHIEVILR